MTTSELSIGTWGSHRKTDAKQGHSYTEGMTGKDLAKDLTMAVSAWPSPAKSNMDGGQHAQFRELKPELLPYWFIVAQRFRDYVLLYPEPPAIPKQRARKQNTQIQLL